MTTRRFDSGGFAVVHDEEEPCPYLLGETARRPLRLPVAVPSDRALDACFERGDRRAGPFFYNQACPTCTACEPLRLRLADFAPSGSQRRAFRKTAPLLEVRAGPPRVDAEHVALFERHQALRGLKQTQAPIDEAGYAAFLLGRGVPTLELSYWCPETGALLGCAITDVGSEAWSAVYTFYEPEPQGPLRAASIGTFSILTQCTLAKQAGARFLYLGLAIRGCAAMEYKFRFVPHERRIAGTWIAFASSAEVHRAHDDTAAPTPEGDTTEVVPSRTGDDVQR